MFDSLFSRDRHHRDRYLKTTSGSRLRREGQLVTGLIRNHGKNRGYGPYSSAPSNGMQIGPGFWSGENLNLSHRRQLERRWNQCGPCPVGDRIATYPLSFPFGHHYPPRPHLPPFIHTGPLRRGPNFDWPYHRPPWMKVPPRLTPPWARPGHFRRPLRPGYRMPYGGRPLGDGFRGVGHYSPYSPHHSMESLDYGPDYSDSHSDMNYPDSEYDPDDNDSSTVSGDYPPFYPHEHPPDPRDDRYDPYGGGYYGQGRPRNPRDSDSSLAERYQNPYFQPRRRH